MTPEQTRRSIARDYAMERLGFRITEITNRIMERLVSPGTARVKIIVPHNSLRQEFAGGLAYALATNGLPIISGSLTRFLGAGYDVSIDPVAVSFLRGQMFDTIYLPPPETLTRQQDFEYACMRNHIIAAEAATPGFSLVVY